MEIKPLDKPKALLDPAFRRAKKESQGMKQERHKVKKAKAQAIRKIEVSANYVGKRIKASVESVPQLDKLHPFYKDLVELTVDFGKFKKSISQFRKVRNLIGKQKRLHLQKVSRIGKRQDPKQADRTVKQFYGRLSSMVNSLEENIEVFNRQAKTLKELPAIKELPSVILAGFPNTGKTTLLKRLTGAKAKIASYPFTTQKIELGYFEQRFFEVQVVDTPGLLDRPEEERNAIERKAASALKHLAKAIVFVLDPTETSGYSLEKQLSLLKEIKRQFKTPLIVALNKSDLASQRDRTRALEKLPKQTVIETGEGLSIEELKKEIVRSLK